MALLSHFFIDIWNNGVWHDLTKALPSRMEELLATEDIRPDDVPDLELNADVLLPADSSGSHKQFQNKDININSRNLELGTFLSHHFLWKYYTYFQMILGGFRPFHLEDKDGNTLWEQFSQGPESMSPYFIIPGKEDSTLMRKICKRMDKEAQTTEVFHVEIEGKKIKFTITFHLSLDGKLIEMTCGLSKYLC